MDRSADTGGTRPYGRRREARLEPAKTPGVRTWQCPLCWAREEVSDEDLAEIGTPMCADCDEEMDVVTGDELYYDEDVVFICQDCQAVFNGEADCLKHADDFSHRSFKKRDRSMDTVENYNPYDDPELQD